MFFINHVSKVPVKTSPTLQVKIYDTLHYQV